MLGAPRQPTDTEIVRGTGRNGVRSGYFAWRCLSCAAHGRSYSSWHGAARAGDAHQRSQHMGR